jgi:hypothetical protein
MLNIYNIKLNKYLKKDLKIKIKKLLRKRYKRLRFLKLIEKTKQYKLRTFENIIKLEKLTNKKI